MCFIVCQVGSSARGDGLLLIQKLLLLALSGHFNLVLKVLQEGLVGLGASPALSFHQIALSLDPPVEVGLFSHLLLFKLLKLLVVPADCFLHGQRDSRPLEGVAQTKVIRLLKRVLYLNRW